MIEIPKDDAALKQFVAAWKDDSNPRAAMGG